MRAFAQSAAIVGSLLLAAPAFAADVPMQPAETSTVTIDATVYHLATPDVVNLSVSCDAPAPGSKADVRSAFRGLLSKMNDAVGSNGTVRRNGSPSIYQYYGGAMPYDATVSDMSQQYSGNMSVSVLNVKNGAGQRIADAIEEMGCTLSWDARLLHTTKYASEHRDELMEQIAEKKAFYDKVLGVNLLKVSNMYVSTSQDTSAYYGVAASYDPESNTLPAMTMMSVTFEIGTGAKK